MWKTGIEYCSWWWNWIFIRKPLSFEYFFFFIRHFIKISGQFFIIFSLAIEIIKLF